MIGEKIRSIRKRKNLTIVEFSEQINVTSGYISQIERDLISPSLTVLKRMSEALEIPLSMLFLDETTENVIIIPKDERTKVKFGNINVELEFLTPIMHKSEKPLGGEAFIFKAPPKSWISKNAIISEGKIFIFIIKGKMDFHVGDKIYSISSGDSICIPENNGHLIYNSNDEISEAMCIMLPITHKYNV